MKYKLEITINAPLQKVFDLFDNPDNFKHWQPGLISYTSLSGTPRAVGSKMKLESKAGGRIVEMIETVKEKNPPHKISFTYEAKGAWNYNRNYFIELEPYKTKWVQENEFKCSGVLKLLQILMPKMFEKDTYKHMKLFQEFVHNQQNQL